MFLLTMLMSLMSIETFAHDIEVANADGVTIYYTYAYTSNNTVLQVSYRGSSSSSYSNEYSGNVVIPESVTYNGTTYSVYSIGYGAFQDCSGLTSITIPNSVTSIGYYAFYGCSGLASITIPSSVTWIGKYVFDGTAWYNNHPDGLVYAGKVAYKYKGIMPANTSIALEEGTLSIAESAFYNCSSLTSITIPNSVTSIGSSAFQGCSGLKSITIPNSVTSIASSVFRNCGSLTTVTIPNSVTRIVDYAFAGCRSLKSVTIPNSVTSIGQYAFHICSSLASITIPNSVTVIGRSAFSGCSSLMSVTIGNSVTTMYDDAFSLTGIYNNTPEGVFYVDNWVCGYKGVMSANTNIVLEEGTLGIAEYAFRNDSNLTNITIPSSVTNIGNNAFMGTAIYNNQSDGLYYVDRWCCGFKGNSDQTNVVIKEGTLGIAKLGYFNALSLTIPSSVSHISGEAFLSGNGLMSVISRINNPMEILENVFASETYSNAMLIVRPGTKEKYQTVEHWNKFQNITESTGNEMLDNLEPIKDACNDIIEEIDKTYFDLTDGRVFVPSHKSALTGTFDAMKGDINNLIRKVDEYESNTNDLTEEALNSLLNIFGTLKNMISTDNSLSPLFTFQWYIQSGTFSCGAGGCMKVDNTLEIRNETKTLYSFYSKAFYHNYDYKGPGYTTVYLIPDNGYRIVSLKVNGGVTTETTFDLDCVDSVVATFEPFNNSSKRTIHVATAGTLPNLIPEYEKYIVEKLTLTGELNGTDLRLLRDMAGNNYLGQNTSGKLAVLDLSNAKVVAGGEKYLDTNLIDGSSIRINGSFHYDVSQDDEMPMYVFCGCNLKKIIIPNSVTSIGSSAFAGCSDLTSVTIGNSVTNIESSVFSSCSSLESVTIGAGVQSIGSNMFNNHRPAKVIWLANTPPSGYNYASGIINYVANDQYTSFNNKTIYRFLSSTFEVDGVKYVPVSPSERICDAIDCTYEPMAESLKIGEIVEYKGVQMKVNQVHPYTCYNNQYVKDVKIACPGDVGQYAFYNCKALATVETNIGGAIGGYAFQSCSALQTAMLGEQVTGIGQYAFSGCSNLQGIVIPDAVMTMGRNAFEICTNMESVKMGTGVETIETYTFTSCSALKDMQIGSNVKNINTYAFNACSSLPLIEIPQSVTTINNNVFDGCTALKDVYIADRNSVLTLGYHYYSNNSNNNKPLFADCPLDSVYIGGNISYGTDKYSGYSPFYRNTSLRSVHITDLETEISDNEFYGCTGLKNVRIGDGVTTIGNWAFSGCSSLDYFRFGGSVETIGKEAFSDCVAVTRIISRAATPPVCGSQALDDLNKWECRLEVPQGMAAAYQEADQWKEFFFVLEGDPSIFKYDIDGSDTVDNNDVNILVNAIIGRGNTSIGLKGDLNNDGFVNMADVTKLIDYILGRTQQ